MPSEPHRTDDRLSRASRLLAGVVALSAAALVFAGIGSAASLATDHAPTATVTLTGPPQPPPAPPGPSQSPWRPTGQLQANVTTADQDGNHVKVSYVWKVDGVVERTVNLTDANNDNFSLQGLQNGDVVSVTVTPNDGTLNGTPVTAQGSIVEHAPTATVSLGGQLDPGGQAVATATGADADGDRVQFSYVWKVNGSVVRTQNLTNSPTDNLPLGPNHYGDVISVTVTPNDGYLNGAPVTATTTLVDTPPTATVTLTGPPQPPPAPPGPSQSPWRPTGQLQANVTTADQDGNHVKVSYVWKVDGVVERTVNLTDANNDNFSLQGLQNGDVVSVTVTPNDGTLNGTPVTAQGSIVEHAPTATVSLGGQLDPGGQAVATATGADADGDRVQFSYVWKVNGSVVRTQNLTNSPTDNLPLGPNHYGDVISVTVTPNDGYLNGAPVTATTTLVDTPPTATLTLSNGAQPPAGPAGPAAPPAGPAAGPAAPAPPAGPAAPAPPAPPAPPAGPAAGPAAPAPPAGPAAGPAAPAPPAPPAPPAGPAAGPAAPPAAPAGPAAPPLGALRPNGQVTANVVTTDADGNHVTLTYVWSVNGNVVRTVSSTNAPNDTYTYSGLSNGDVISVTVTPNDGYMNGTAVTVSGTVVEHAPTASVTIGGALRPGGVAVAMVTASDADNDPITFSYVWSVNGAVEQIDTNQHSASDNFNLGPAIQPGDTISVRVIPNDGYLNGAVATASTTVGAAVTTSNANYNPADDPYSMYDTTLFTGAQAWWNAGYTGQGVDVALIDTGVTQVPGLQGSNKVVYGPDLSLDSDNPSLHDLDSNGHGTFMAGLIAGHDSNLTTPYSADPPSVYRGMAPDARIISVKVGATDGAVDVTQVIAGIDWVVQHAHDPGFNIRVISLSYGTDSTQPYLVDPLAYAVEQAWKAGIVVVAAAGNTGFDEGTGAPGLSDPAYDPFVIGVGGYDDMGTSTAGDDRIGDYSASSAGCAPETVNGLQAPLCKAPDLLNAGSHLQGLRDPGSYIDDNNPTGELGTRYFRGSGTSEATALTAGAIALILQKYPQMTPDDVKKFLIQGARAIPGIDAGTQGAGEVQLSQLLNQPAVVGATQNFAPSIGAGSIEASRGGSFVSDDGVTLTGNEDIFGSPINTSALASLEANDDSWTGGAWNGNTWSGNSWSGNSWSGNSWSGNSWSGNSWSGNSWSGNSWSGNSWSGNSWSGNSWSGNSWSGNSWSGNSWSSALWQ